MTDKTTLSFRCGTTNELLAVSKIFTYLMEHNVELIYRVVFIKSSTIKRCIGRLWKLKRLVENNAFVV